MSDEEKKEPEDLGVKIGSKREARWTQVRDQAKSAIEESEIAIKINKAIVSLADQIISEEEAKKEKSLNKTTSS